MRVRRRISQVLGWAPQLLAALRTRDPDVVADVIRQHNRLALDAYLDYLTQSGQLVLPTLDKAAHHEE